MAAYVSNRPLWAVYIRGVRVGLVSGEPMVLALWRASWLWPRVPLTDIQLVELAPAPPQGLLFDL